MNLEEPTLSGPPRSAREPLTSISVQTRYTLLRQLGAGGMAVVHLAAIEREDGFSRNVALKVVRDDYASFPEFARMFAMEASLAARLTHPNIVGIFDYCRDERARPFLVMEVVNGISLRQVLHQKPPMPLPVVAFVMAEVLRGLRYAHQLPRGTGIRGLLHRDISPHNILLSWEGAVKISDFGIAKALMTTSGMIPGEAANGKPAYMSPEQVASHSLDRRSDLFSLGVVFWEMLAGKKLFHGAHPSEIFKQIATQPIPSPGGQRPVPTDLERISKKLLERDRERRYACAEDVLTDLLRCRDMTSNGAGELSALLAARFPTYARSGTEESSEEQTPGTTPPEAAARETMVDVDLEAPRRPSVRRLVGAAALAVVALATAIAMSLRGAAEGPVAGGQVRERVSGPVAPLPPASAGSPESTPSSSKEAAIAPALAPGIGSGFMQGARGDKQSKKATRAAPKAGGPALSPKPSGILNVRFDGSAPPP
jgi:serine/threonine protein kinase